MKEFVLLLLLFCSQLTYAQSVHCLTDGYMLPLDLKYGREAPVQDLAVIPFYHLLNKSIRK